MAINALIRGDYEQAAAGFRHTIAIDPDWTWGYIKLGRTLSLQNKCKDAFVQTEIAERRIAGGAGVLSRSWLGATYATCGDTTRAGHKLDELKALEAKQYVDPVAFADIYAALNKMDEALRWYEKGFSDRSPKLVSALAASRVAPQLADNPGYQSILRRMAFPQPTK
jgi:tetratricopeptide (TPR) repeat protein